MDESMGEIHLYLVSTHHYVGGGDAFSELNLNPHDRQPTASAVKSLLEEGVYPLSPQMVGFRESEGWVVSNLA